MSFTDSSLAALLRPGPKMRGADDPLSFIGVHLLETIGDGTVRQGLSEVLAASPGAAEVVAALLDQSAFLLQIVRRRPHWLLECLTEVPAACLDRLRANVTLGARELDEPGLMAALRHFRSQAALLIALADCGGVWSVEQATAAITRIAETAVGLAVDHLLRKTAALGRMSIAHPDRPGDGSGFVVLALGKMGAGELNYSSDIDIVLFYDPAVVPDGEHARVFTRLAHGLVKLLQERTADGYVFRVDLRLRPDPGSTAPAVSLPAAYGYYETLGQNWERAAFIKARPVAGDIALGRRFLDDLKPFIWRKYFDFATIADIHAMKRQIHAVRGHDAIAVAGHDIKLGRGGIREIEFFVQTQQLVFGGRRPALRGARTLDMLSALHQEGWISQTASRELRQAYRFLRTVEHRLQMVADEQTQRLPADPETLKAFARFCGYDDTAAFGRALTGWAKIVQGHYAMLFEEAPTLAGEIGNLVFTGTQDDPDTLATIARLGFRDAAAVAEIVRGWHYGRRSAVTHARAREALTEITPALLVSFGRTPDPDAALLALDRAFAKMPAATELLTLLGSQAGLRDLFADILGSAPRLAETVAASPHVLDAVIDPAFVDATVSEADISARMRAMLGEPPDMEAFLDRMREIARHERFLVGARLLSGVLSPDRAGEAYSAVAAASVSMVLRRVCIAFAADHGEVPGASLVVLALGRLGLSEMTAGSDLDLMVVYDGADPSALSDGARPLDAVTYHIRLTQRLIGAMTSPTRRGTLYEVDMRLRPSGRKGPLATKLASFQDYYANEAETWERLALSKARPIAGDPDLAARIVHEIDTVLAASNNQPVRADLSAMRALLAKEKGDADPWDMKTAAGGITDIDFTAGAILLTRPELIPVRSSGPSGVLTAATDAGLIGQDQAAALIEARRVFGDLLQWQRLLVRERFDPAKVAPPVAQRLAVAMGAANPSMLRAGLDERRQAVRAIFDDVVER